jgi:hypothetical protein
MYATVTAHRTKLMRRNIAVEAACRVVDVSVSGVYDQLSRSPLGRSVRQAWTLAQRTGRDRFLVGLIAGNRTDPRLRALVEIHEAEPFEAFVGRPHWGR